MIESVLSSLFTLENLLWINVGLAGGIMVGALPGLTGTMAMALLLPLTYGLASIPGVMLLLGVYCGSIYGGSITAILINTPGTPELEIDWKGCAARGAASLALSKHVHQPPKAAKNDMFGG